MMLTLALLAWLGFGLLSEQPSPGDKVEKEGVHNGVEDDLLF